MGTPIDIPARATVVLSTEKTALASATNTASPQVLISPAALAQALRELIDQSRATGSPRPLGLAVGLLDRLPQTQWTADVYLMRATIRQRLHRFDQAEADLDQVLQRQPDNLQAWLTRYSIALVRDDLVAAGSACNELEQRSRTLLAESCKQELASFAAQPNTAFERLRQALELSSSASAIERDYVLVTLADMATRLDLPEAGIYWQRALLQNSDDLYRRARYADWLLSQGQDEKALEVTSGFDEVDTLAVLQAIAMTRLKHPEQPRLVGDLEERFAEARWRGEFLHQWEYARFLLDVKGDAQAAFLTAQANWKTQRAQPDRELLIRAAAIAGKSDGLDDSARDGGPLL
ncbi:tetratricopeptide repeat protein [Halopseudomonas sp.]|jgi:tetratricopeptide (TPR) repeat protein|uniref:tetratricopeptide repeat protein n=1 Tax=Halopseudomonas sp. TaxID=2901191 RepID=UPI0039E38BA7